MKNKNILVYLCIILFGLVGIYLTFISGNTSKYDSETTASRIDLNEQYDSDGIMYSPIYYFNVNQEEYKCESNSSSSTVPNENKNKVYYDSKNPKNCKTEYEKTSNTFAGIVCLIVTFVIAIIVIKKPTVKENEIYEPKKIDVEKQNQINENTQKAIIFLDKAQLIYKRIVIGFIIIILSIFTLIDTAIFKQTIIARNYIETTATYVEKQFNNDKDSIFDDYLYTFKDKQGNEQKITVSVSKDTTPEETIKIKYNENNFQDYYEDGSTMDKKEFIWYIIKIIALTLLIILFFNKKWLNKINISAN